MEKKWLFKKIVKHIVLKINIIKKRHFIKSNQTLSNRSDQLS